MAVANPVITRDEFEKMSARVTALETPRATVDTEPSPPVDDGARHAPTDFVRQDEFRLFKWLGSFALATVLGGFALLYEQTSDVRIAMERMHAEALREMLTQNESIREDMHAQIASVRQDMHAIHASIREDMHALHTSIREDMHAEHAATRKEISGVRERVVRLETLDNVESP